MLPANYLAQIADNIFDYTPEASVMTAWLGRWLIRFKSILTFRKERRAYEMPTLGIKEPAGYGSVFLQYCFCKKNHLSAFDFR